MASNSVPLGQAGTGAAFLLDGSQALNRMLQTQDYNAQVRAQEQALKQREAQNLANDWQKNMLKVDGGLYWQPEFQKRSADLIQKGVKLRQLGVNPYRIDPNDPLQSKVAENFLLEKQSIESDMTDRKAREAAVAEQFKLIKADPTGYRKQSIADLNAYVQLPFSEAKRLPVPTLEKSYNPETELFSKVKPVTTATTTRVVEGKNSKEDFKITEKTIDIPATKKEAVSTLLGTQKGVQYVEDETGVPISALNKIPDTVEENVKVYADRYAGDPKFREDIAVQFKVTTPEQAQPILAQMAMRDFSAKNRFNEIVNTAVQRASGGVNLIDSKVPDNTRYNREQDAEKLRLARQREARIASGDGDGVNAGDYEVERIELKTSPQYKDGKEIPNSGGKIAATLDKSVKVRSVAFPSTQIKSAFDISVGKNVPLESKSDLKLARIGYTTVKGGKKELKAIVVDSDNNEYILDEREVPIDIRKTKAYIAAKQAIGSPPSSAKKPATVSKTTTFKGIPKGGF